MMELTEVRELSEWEGEPLPYGFRVQAEYCDEWAEMVVKLYRVYKEAA